MPPPETILKATSSHRQVPEDSLEEGPGWTPGPGPAFKAPLQEWAAQGLASEVHVLSVLRIIEGGKVSKTDITVTA